MKLLEYTITLYADDLETVEAARCALEEANADLKVKALGGYLAGVVREHTPVRLEIQSG